MSTLTTPPVSTLIARLFADAAAADSRIRISPEELAALKTDYKKLYHFAKDAFLPVSPDTGNLLYLLARSSRARSVVEFGTSFGISTIHLAAALRDNGGGLLIGSEFEPEKAARARSNLREAGLADLVEIREGDALESLARDLPERIDLVLLDGAKVLYRRILALLEPSLAAGALVVADNADESPEYLARVREGRGYLSVPFASDVEVSLKL